MNNCTQIKIILTFLFILRFQIQIKPGIFKLIFQLIDTVNHNSILYFISVGWYISKTMTKYHKNVDWKNDQERFDFEEEIRMWKARRQEWTWCQTLVWILEIFVLNFLVILALYGGKLDIKISKNLVKR